ncbi:regulated-SNARE-like domain protein [Gregarina niphandrodes]|uniref:Regulated-SNARE-like domain protein n=1 Tax=Gregarina niphandrodes TaxID=110365 RepID=A0A023B8T4_GRENI|nr:regulated-SNARE-like domain protein [Gregarina niphandrodes]EZG69606.1 regulated-SNARE-like domain protein [Gregarina niphandrodes]|eukprot:XP_011130000.1 regulated-SNARE-like domain protein [Gregarina niphandrodes]
MLFTAIARDVVILVEWSDTKGNFSAVIRSILPSLVASSKTGPVVGARQEGKSSVAVLGSAGMSTTSISTTSMATTSMSTAGATGTTRKDASLVSYLYDSQYVFHIYEEFDLPSIRYICLGDKSRGVRLPYRYLMGLAAEFKTRYGSRTPYEALPLSLTRQFAPTIARLNKHYSQVYAANDYYKYNTSAMSTIARASSPNKAASPQRTMADHNAGNKNGKNVIILEDQSRRPNLAGPRPDSLDQPLLEQPLLEESLFEEPSPNQSRFKDPLRESTSPANTADGTTVGSAEQVLERKIDEINNVLIQSLDKIINRKERIDLLVEKTSNIQRASTNFARYSTKSNQHDPSPKHRACCVINMTISLTYITNMSLGSNLGPVRRIQDWLARRRLLFGSMVLIGGISLLVFTIETK